MVGAEANQEDERQASTTELYCTSVVAHHTPRETSAARFFRGNRPTIDRHRESQIGNRGKGSGSLTGA